MDNLRPEKGVRWRARHILVLVALTGVVTAAAHGCERPPPQAPRVAAPSRPDQCWTEHAAELLLGDLAVSVLRAYGRIDPQLIAVNSDTGQLQVSAESVVNPEFADQFQQALAAVNKDETARRAFRIGVAGALAACGPEDCPSTRYEFVITPEETPDGSSFNHWVVKDELPPTDVQWRDGFLRQYRYLSPECCPLQPVLLVPDPDGEEAATSQLDKGELAAARPRTRFRTGKQQDGTCETGHVTQSCRVTCERSRDVFMKWRKAGRDTICCDC